MAPVHLLEGGARHEDLAAHFEDLRRLAFQFERDAVDRAHIGSHLFAHLAIAASGGPHQRAFLVAQADRQAIELELRRVFDRRIAGLEAKLAADARIEVRRAGVLRIGLGADGEHRHLMAHRRQILGWRAAHSLRG